jgi:putative hydrolase of the HAD superfamily
MIQAVLFDLDDTLYEEADFFRGGFAAVAQELESRGAGSAARIRRELADIHFGQGRDGVLTKVAERLAFPAEWVPELVAVFRAHQPVLEVAGDVPATLERLRRRYRLGCITDGFADVQRRKLHALGLADAFDAIVIADDHGRQNWKPAAYPFLLCCRSLGVTTDCTVFVGDNPDRDMAGARNAGLRSIRIRRERGYFCRYACAAYPADYEITDLETLIPLLESIDAVPRVPAGDAR